jgi:Rne/Rng family ribonuclease
MSKEMFISSSPHETKVAVLEDDQLVEVYFERDTDVGLVGGIYKGRVSRVLPGMQSAFVDIGLERDAFLYVSDFFYEDQEEYDKVFEEAEARATKFTTQQAAGPLASAASAIPPLAEPLPPLTTEVSPSPASFGVPPPQEPPAPAATMEPPAVAVAEPANAPKDFNDRRPFDPRRGRRRRHRGRPEYSGNRPGDRRFPAATPREAPPTETQAFEILPGESLAKYRNTGGALAAEGETGEEVSREVYGKDSLRSGIERSSRSETDGTAPGPSAPELPRDEDTIAHDGTVAFTPAAIYSPNSPAAAVTTPAAPAGTAAAGVIPPQNPVIEAAAVSTVVGTEPVAEIPPPSLAFTAEVVASYTPDGVAGPSSGDPEPKESATASRAAETPSAAPESPSERAEADVLEDESEGENDVEGLDDAEELEAGTEAERLAEAFEGQLDDQGGISPEVVAKQGGEDPADGLESAVADQPPVGAPGQSEDRNYTLREPNQRPRFAPRRRRGRRGPAGGGDRGPRRPETRREPQRAGGNHHPVQIAEVLKEGQEILVQIAKEPLGTKGARITSHVALPGRYLVFMPTIDHIGVSRKIASEEERLRLRNIILENKGPLTGGFIVRTAGQGRSEEEFKADLTFLSTLWSEIRAKHDRLKAPALIHRDLDLVQRLLRDLLTPDFKSVRVDSETDYERVLDFVSRCQPALVGKVKLYSRDTPLYEEFGIQAELDKALKPKVWLKSGGYIVINQTEALVAIDVNTGKYVGKTNRLEDTIVKTNVDAVNEIVRQVRLRDLGGIIVIDFIDMDERKNRARVVQALEEALRFDRAPTKVIAFNDFGLVAVTRKRVKQSLERTLCVPCSYCTGAGWVKSVNTVCNEILAEARKMAKGIDGNVLTLRVNPEVAKALKSREGSLVSELELLTKKDVIIKGDANVHQERFEIY